MDEFCLLKEFCSLYIIEIILQFELFFSRFPVLAVFLCRRLGPGVGLTLSGQFGRFRLVLIEGRVLGVAAVERVFGLEAVERIGAPGLGHVGEAVGAKLFQHRRLGLRADRRVGGDQQRFSRAGMDAGFSMS
ncbi:hypothetical protein CVT23_05535, partial [Minwuia thermotolerans]